MSSTLDNTREVPSQVTSEQSLNLIGLSLGNSDIFSKLQQNDHNASTSAVLPEFRISHSDTAEKLSEASDDQSSQVSEAAKAIKSGKAAEVNSLMEKASIRLAGDLKAIDKFASELAEQLKDHGIEIRSGGGQGDFSVHRIGEESAVDFRLANEKTAKPEFKAQSYDWVTKRDIKTAPSEVIGTFAANDQREKKPELLDAKQLAKLYDAAGKGDLKDVYTAIQRSVLQAHKIGGMEAVREFEKNINKRINAPNGPAIIEEDGKLKLYKASVADQADVIKALENGTLKKEGLVKHPTYGYVRLMETGPSVEIPSRKP